MSKDGFQLTGDAARTYEEQKVPAMFEPLARATLALHQVRPGDRVLDVACGTGIVARIVREQFGSVPRVTGVDLNEAMIETARVVSSRDGVVADFHVCDVTSTPFDDGEFTFIICQQGLQYFPAEDAALAELLRVAAHGARFAFTVWSRPSPLIAAFSDSVRAHAGATLAEKAIAPFAWTGADTIVERMRAVGYVDVNIEELEVDRTINDPEQGVPKEIMSTPAGPPVADMGEAVFRTVVNEMLEATQHYRHGDRLVIPQHTHLISAVAP
jgi:ubiquinone/menaquinone biosynthesis C-methylase UbiE